MFKFLFKITQAFYHPPIKMRPVCVDVLHHVVCINVPVTVNDGAHHSFVVLQTNDVTSHTANQNTVLIIQLSIRIIICSHEPFTQTTLLLHLPFDYKLNFSSIIKKKQFDFGSISGILSYN